MGGMVFLWVGKRWVFVGGKGIAGCGSGNVISA